MGGVSLAFAALPGPPRQYSDTLPHTPASGIDIWFLLSNTAFPWRHDTIGTAEDLGIFFGGMWVLC